MTANLLEQLREGFRAEALDLLIELDSALLDLEREPADMPLVHRVFRAIHTIKGSGATAGFAHLARFAHQIEEAFDLARAGRLTVTPDLIDCGLKSCDVIRLLIERDNDEVVTGEGEITASLRHFLPDSKFTPGKPTSAQPKLTSRTAYEITIRPHRNIFYSGADPAKLLDDLREIGSIHVTAFVDAIPPLTSLDPEQCFLWWKVLFVSEFDSATVKEVFEFVENDCDIRIRYLDNQSASVALLGAVPAEAFEAFKLESEEHLERIENDALAIEENLAARDKLDSLFRGIHSIKGNAGLLLGQVSGEPLDSSHPLQLLFTVAHKLESLLDPFRSPDAGSIPYDAIQTTLETCDAIRTLLGSLTHNGAGGDVSPELLRRLGVEITPPLKEEFRSEAFRNTTSQCLEMIAGCFARLEDRSQPPLPVFQTYLRGLRTLSAAAQYQNFPGVEEPVARQLRILDGAVTRGEALADSDQAELSGAFKAICSALDGSAKTAPTQRPPAGPASSSANAGPADKPQSQSPASTVRIDQEKLDRLMRIVGELLVARGAFPLLAQKLNGQADPHAVAKDLKEAGSNISRIADDLQASVMSIRMLPVRTVFQRYPRLVRDLARSLGKEVRLVIEGESIELDKTILEQIGDPLVHVIRNSLDHGLEPPADRLAAGKDATGLLKLKASHEAGGVVLEISDDGRGLNGAILKEKAVEKGLITAEAAAALNEEGAFQLVFLPGFSTAAKITDVSGRGVGMDVLRSNVRNLQGTIEIHSKLGLGTTIVIKLPTSLMISKGILLTAAGQEYILPLGNIHDMVKLPAEQLHEYQGMSLAAVRGSIYPSFPLAELLGQSPTKMPELSIAIVQAGALRYGIVVDKFVSEVEVLVKPLHGGLENCKEFQGAAIMGDGRVVLVLNVQECHRLASAG